MFILCLVNNEPIFMWNIQDIAENKTYGYSGFIKIKQTA